MKLQILLFIWTCVNFIGADSDSSRESSAQVEEHKLQIHPTGLEGDKYVVKADKAFRIACVYNGEDMENVHQLKWVNEDNKQIDGTSSNHLFTIALHEHGTHHKKQSLVFAKINSRDSGTYTCIAEVEGETIRRSIHVHVVGNIEWREPRDVVGAMVGESLTINCGAKGNPQPEIEMTNEEGELLDGAEFVVVDNEVTIESLDKKHQGTKIRCLALQLIPEYATTSVEKHEIAIDVWFHPEFEKQEISRHAILGRATNLYCNVSESNPPIAHFNFFKDNVEIEDDDDNYEITVLDDDSQSAILKVNVVNEDDLGTYRCEVNNGKAKAHQLINLHMANPPNQVKASLERARKHSISWRLRADESEEDDQLPVISYKIEYVRSRLLDDIDSSEEEDTPQRDELEREEEHIWKAHGSHVIRARSEDDLYELHGLVQDAEYVFRFTAMNEAGAGDPIEITARTHSGRLEKSAANAVNVFTFAITVCILFNSLMNMVFV